MYIPGASVVFMHSSSSISPVQALAHSAAHLLPYVTPLQHTGSYSKVQIHGSHALPSSLNAKPSSQLTHVFLYSWSSGHAINVQNSKSPKPQEHVLHPSE